MKEYLPDILPTKINDSREEGKGVYIKKCFCGNTFYSKTRRAKFCCETCKGRFAYLKKINKIETNPSMPDVSIPEIPFPVENQPDTKKSNDNYLNAIKEIENAMERWHHARDNDPETLKKINDILLGLGLLEWFNEK